MRSFKCNCGRWFNQNEKQCPNCGVELIYEKYLSEDERKYAAIEASRVTTSIREYREEDVVSIQEEEGRVVVVAINEGGYNSTAVDLLDVIAWIKENRPELLE